MLIMWSEVVIFIASKVDHAKLSIIKAVKGHVSVGIHFKFCVHMSELGPCKNGNCSFIPGQSFACDSVSRELLDTHIHIPDYFILTFN